MDNKNNENNFNDENQQMPPYGAANADNGYQNNQPQNPQYNNPRPPYGNQQNPYMGQPPVMNGQPNTYGQQQYNPYMQPPKKKSKALLIVLIVVAVIVVLFVGTVALFATSGYKIFNKWAISDFAETNEISDLVDVCDTYNDMISTISDEDAQKAEPYFTLLMSDMSQFQYYYSSSDAVNYYDSHIDALNVFASDYFYLLIKNGQDDKFVSEFTRMMLEYSPSDVSYIDSYTFISNVSSNIYVLNDAQKLLVVRAYDNLIENCPTQYEKRMNLQEYAECCNAFGLFDKAAELTRRMNAMDVDE